MKIAIVGSRTFQDYNLLEESIQSKKINISLIVSGGAKGADSLGEYYAKVNKIPTMIFKPDWKKYGKAAGFIRNSDIIKNADVIFAFWDFKSKGTENSIKLAKKQRKIIYVIDTRL